MISLDFDHVILFILQKFYINYICMLYNCKNGSIIIENNLALFIKIIYNFLA